MLYQYGLVNVFDTSVLNITIYNDTLNAVKTFFCFSKAVYINIMTL